MYGKLYPLWPGTDRKVVGGTTEENAYWVLSITSAGLPLRSLAGGSLFDSQSIKNVGIFCLGKHEFALLPIWPGFAINTIFYATGLWLLGLIPVAVRRHIRFGRGQCRACGYDLRGREHGKASEPSVCPECGGAQSSSRNAAENAR